MINNNIKASRLFLIRKYNECAQTIAFSMSSELTDGHSNPGPLKLTRYSWKIDQVLTAKRSNPWHFFLLSTVI